MTVTAKEIMVLAGRVLQDESAARWTLPELCDWLNEAIRAIVLAKPSASAETVTIALAAGTWQQLPVTYLSLMRVTRNILAAGPPRVGGRAIRVTSRDGLDAVNPSWHDPSVVKYAAEVRQFVFDDDDPLSFFVYPGNTGTGVVEAIVSVLPAPVVASGDVTEIGSYDADVGLKDVYQPPILDWVLYRAFSKDDTAASPSGAQSHYQAFAMALGIKDKVSIATSPNARPAVQA